LNEILKKKYTKFIHSIQKQDLIKTLRNRIISIQPFVSSGYVIYLSHYKIIIHLISFTAVLL